MSGEGGCLRAPQKCHGGEGVVGVPEGGFSVQGEWGCLRVQERHGWG